MASLRLLGITATLTALSASPSISQAIQLDAGELRSFTDELVEGWLKQEGIPGATFAFVADGDIVFAAGYGLADIERDVPVDPDRTLFRVASLSKPVTATAIAQLVEGGKLAFEDDLDRYLPQLATRADPRGVLRLHHLLTHTAGYDDHNIGRVVRRLEQMPPPPLVLARTQPRRVYAPGEICSYSNYGFFALGQVIETVSGQAFADYMQEHVLGVLGMTQSSFAPDQALAADFAKGYQRVGDLRRAVDHGWDIGGAASSLSTTATDYAQFMLAQLGQGARGDARVLTAESVATLQHQQFTHHPRLAGTCYGWFERNRHGWRRLEHGGHWTGFSSRVVLVPELGAGAFLSMNAEWAGWPVTALLHRFFDHILPVRQPQAATESTTGNPIPAGHAFELAGTYQTTHRARSNLERITNLFGYSTVTAIDAGRLRFHWVDYVEVEPYLFLPAAQQDYVVYPQPLAFELAPDGGLRLYQDRLSYERVPWYDTHAWQAGFAGACVATSLMSLLLWLIGAIRRRDVHATVARARGLAGLLSLQVAVVGCGLYFSVDYAMGSNGGEFAYGVPWWTVALLTLPLIAVVLTAWLAADVARAWRHRYGRFAMRVWLTVAVVGQVGLLAWLWHWNLLGYWF